jgi:uncharacterized membrane protein
VMSSKIPKKIRAPVNRADADRNLLLMLLSFGSSVVLTRLFLEITGYPQLGSGELHIAHVLWGGLFLFTATLILLIMTNRWVFPLAAVLGGIGVGLFIDEVGKFITQTNDYFHPAAAPIIYATFLLTVFLYVRVRKPSSFDERAQLYWALETLQEVLDQDLEQFEIRALEGQLSSVASRTRNPVYQSLSKHMLAFLQSEYVVIVSVEPSWWARILERLQIWGERWLHTSHLKAALVGGLSALGIWEFSDLIQLLVAAQDPARFIDMVAMWTELGNIASIPSIFWFATRVTIEGIVGVLMVISSLLLIFRRDRAGAGLAVLALMFALTAANLVAFYVDQFSTILNALIQFILLLIALVLQRRIEVEKSEANFKEVVSD